MRFLRLILFLAVMFAGSALAQDIAEVKADAFDGGTNTYFAHDIMFTSFTVTGRVTSPFLGFTNDTVIFIQDTSAGIRVESIPGIFQLETNTAAFPLGVLVKVYGMIDQSNGMRMIRPEWYDGDPYDTATDFSIVGTTTTPVSPEITTVANYLAQGEDFEGKLIRVNGLTMGTNAWAYRANSSLTITDSTGTITLFIDRNTDVDGQLPPTNTFDLIGLASQYSTLPIPSNGYEVMPRRYSDFIQSVGAEAPSIYIPVTNTTAFINSPYRLYLVGRDRNAGDALVLGTNTAPSGSVFVALGGREARLDWTPGSALANTTNTAVFRVSDGTTTNTAGAAIRVLPRSGGPGYAWINEFHYDDFSVTGMYEGVELAGSAGVDLSSYYLLFYSGDTLYLSNNCSGVIPDESLGYGAVWFAIPGLSNSAPGGIALMHQTRGLLQLLSYEGVMMPTNGGAAGAMSVDVGLKEDPATTGIGYSLQLQGGGTNYEDFTWAGPLLATRGTLNTNGQYIPPHAIVAFTNLSLSPASPHPNQAFHILCTVTPNSTASNLSSVAWLRLNGGAWTNIDMTNTVAFTNRTVTQVSGQTNNTLLDYYVATSFIGPGTNSPMASTTNSFLILNHPPVFSNLTDKSVVETNTLNFTVRAGDEDSDFITLTASNVPSGAEFSPTSGVGSVAGPFVWTNAQPVGTYTTVFYAADADNIVSTSVVITVIGVGDLSTNIWINEIHYENTGADVEEGVEIAGAAGVDLSSFALYVYNGNSGKAYSPTTTLSGVIDNETNDYGAVWFAIVGLQNGPSDAVALVQSGTVIQFLSYEGVMTAVDGPAAGMTSVDIGVSETDTQPTGLSLQLEGMGTYYGAFVWHGPTNLASRGVLNIGQLIQAGGEVDGIPGAWWDRYGISAGERIATNNPDGDVNSNYEEYAADTDPTNSASYFVYRVTNMTGFGTVQLLVGPPTTNSRLYDAWWVTNLMNQSWTPFNFNATGRADGASFYLVVTNDAQGRFYRTGVKVP